jgi:AraC-like DNA-binding protein
VLNSWELVFRGAGVAVALALAAALLARGGWRRHLELVTLVACAGAYLVCSAAVRPCCSEPAALPLLGAAAAFPFAFWRLARLVMEDSRLIPRAAWAGLALLLASAAVAAADYVAAPLAARMAAAVLNKAVAIAFVAGALYAAWNSREGDLVEPRRRLRWFVIGYVGLYGLTVLAAEAYLLGAAPPAWLDSVNAGLIAATLLATLVYLLQPSPAAVDTLFAPARPAAPARAAAGARPDPDGAVLQRLHAVVDGEQAWRDPALSIGALAHRAAVPEYVLRRVINERLGHRNFAAFVNEYRLQEVALALRDPRLARRPILTLALEAGFGSIGPFNRAFRDRFGVTPSEYRAGGAPPPAMPVARPD